MSTFARVDVALIDNPVLPLRDSMDDYKLEELFQDIRDHGLLYPPLVQQNGERYEVVDGHRRMLCIRRLEWKQTPVLIQDANDAPPEAAKLKANLLREDNTDAEMAEWLSALAFKHNWSLEQLCRETQRSASWINDRVALLQGDEAVFNALKDREISFAVAKVLNKCPHEDVRRYYLHYAMIDKLPAARIDEAIKRHIRPADVGVTDAAQQNPGVQTVDTAFAGMTCFCCGGDKDAFNMKTIHVHYWHLQHLQKLFEKADADAMETARLAGVSV